MEFSICTFSFSSRTVGLFWPPCRVYKDLPFLTRDRTCAPCSPNHWTSRESPGLWEILTKVFKTMIPIPHHPLVIPLRNTVIPFRCIRNRTLSFYDSVQFLFWFPVLLLLKKQSLSIQDSLYPLLWSRFQVLRIWWAVRIWSWVTCAHRLLKRQFCYYWGSHSFPHWGKRLSCEIDSCIIIP